MVDTYFGRFLTLPRMREMSVAEQRYQAVLAVIAEGDTIRSVADRWRVSRWTIHAWLARRPKLLAGVVEGAAAEVPSESAIYRALSRARVIDASARRRRDQSWKRWERGMANEL